MQTTRPSSSTTSSRAWSWSLRGTLCGDGRASVSAADAAEAVAVRRDEGVYSGREIARRLRWDLRFRYLAGGLAPDFRTINRFRIRHREDFAQVFRETVHTARASGLAQLGRVAIDGTKIRANTSRHKAMSHGRMDPAEAQLEAEIAEILSEARGGERERGRHARRRRRRAAVCLPSCRTGSGGSRSCAPCASSWRPNGARR